MTKAVIISGGWGTRLRPLTCTIPKSLIPVVNKPVIERQILLLKAAGVREVVRMGKIAADQPITTIYRTTKSAGVMTGYEQAKFRDDPDYNKLPAWRKLAFWTIRKTEDGNFVQIPVGFLSGMLTKLMWMGFYDTMYKMQETDPDIQQVISAYDENALDSMGEGWDSAFDEYEYSENNAVRDALWDERKRQFSMGVAETIGEQQPVPGVGSLFGDYKRGTEALKDFTLSILPQNLKGAGELAWNWDEWRGRPINYEQTMPKRGATKLTMFDEYTSPSIIRWSEFADKYTGSGKFLGPRDWEHLMEAYMGNVGTDLIREAENLTSENTVSKAREGRLTSTRWLLPRRKTPFGVVKDAIASIGRRGFTAEPSIGTRSPEYKAFFRIQNESETHYATVSDYLDKGMYGRAIQDIRENPEFITKETLMKVIDRVEDNPYAAKQIKKKFGRNRRDYYASREFALPSTIISDTKQEKGYIDDDIRDNIHSLAIRYDMMPTSDYKDKRKVWLQARKIERSLRRDQGTLFRDAITRYYSVAEKELPVIEEYLSQVTDDELEKILRYEDVRNSFIRNSGPNRILGARLWEHKQRLEDLPGDLLYGNVD